MPLLIIMHHAEELLSYPFASQATLLTAVHPVPTSPLVPSAGDEVCDEGQQ